MKKAWSIFTPHVNISTIIIAYLLQYLPAITTFTVHSIIYFRFRETGTWRHYWSVEWVCCPFNLSSRRPLLALLVSTWAQLWTHPLGRFATEAIDLAVDCTTEKTFEREIMFRLATKKRQGSSGQMFSWREFIQRLSMKWFGFIWPLQLCDQLIMREGWTIICWKASM